MVSSVLLMLVVSQSASLFSQSLGALGKARLRDGVNAAIAADLEQVRHEVFTWSADATPSLDGQLSYSPLKAACDGGTLATQLLADRSTALASQKTLTFGGNNSNGGTPPADNPVNSTPPLSIGAGGSTSISINRTISVDPGDANVLLVRYTTQSGSLVSVQQTTALVPPAQGWCP